MWCSPCAAARPASHSHCTCGTPAQCTRARSEGHTEKECHQCLDVNSFKALECQQAWTGHQAAYSRASDEDNRGLGIGWSYSYPCRSDQSSTWAPNELPKIYIRGQAQNGEMHWRVRESLSPAWRLGRERVEGEHGDMASTLTERPSMRSLRRLLRSVASIVSNRSISGFLAASYTPPRDLRSPNMSHHEGNAAAKCHMMPQNSPD